MNCFTVRSASTIMVVYSLTFVLVADGRADVVTFGTQNIDHLMAAGVQTEGTYTYQATVGPAWELTTDYGNPGASLATFFNDEDSVAGDTVEIKAAGAGLFNFSSVDYRSIFDNNSDGVAITGYIASIPVGTLSLNSSTTTFTTVLSGFATTPIDLLRVVVTSKGGNAKLLDNFQLSGIPEPSTLLLLGIGAISLLGRRKAKSHG